MPNTLNIPERTLAQLSSATDSINVIGGVNGRRSAYQPLVVRVTDHADNVTAETGNDANRMALFMSSAHGQPWIKDTGLRHIVVRAAANPVTTPTRTDVTVLFPNFDYTTFS